jgi:uncharacterized protein YkwD
VNTSTDEAHCGGCSEPCAIGETCENGACDEVGIPDNAYCSATQGWSTSYTLLEFQILDIVNQRRAEGADCGSQGYFPPAGPLSMHSELRCAARKHSKDMVDRDYFSHTNPDGWGPGQRLNAAGYSGAWGENIAAGNSTAAATMTQWMNSAVRTKPGKAIQNRFALSSRVPGDLDPAAF